MTTTSPTSSMATSLLTRKPERGRIQPPLGDGLAEPAAFLARGSCGRLEFAVIPPPSESEALRPNRSAMFLENGAIAQLGERFNGIEEVVGSIPSGATNNSNSLPLIIIWQRTPCPIR
jgi:hypothetical protein